MGELNDYSDEFKPDLKMENFSKEALIRLWHAAGRMYTSQAQVWHDVVEEKLDKEIVKEIEAEVWRREDEKEINIIRHVMNIWGDDVASVFKHLQVDPGAGGIWTEDGYELELKDKNTGVLTIKNCTALNYLEKTGQKEYQKFVCEVLDGEGFEITARVFHPKMTAKPLKLPPRKGKDEIACQWEFKLEL